MPALVLLQVIRIALERILNYLYSRQRGICLSFMGQGAGSHTVETTGALLRIHDEIALALCNGDACRLRGSDRLLNDLPSRG